MCKRQVVLFCLLSCFLGITSGFSQAKLVTKADTSFEQLSYSDAISYYLAVLNKSEPTAELLIKLADAYFYNGDYIEAYPYYESAFALPMEINADVVYRHILTIRSIGNYQYAQELMEDMVATFPQDNRVVLYQKNQDYLKHIENNRGDFSVTALDALNTDNSDFGATIYKGNLVYASAKQRNEYYRRIHTWTNEPFTKLYQAPIFIDGKVGKSKPFLKRTRFKFNESTPVFTKDGKTMYFSSNQRKVEQGDQEFNEINLYRASLKNGRWTDFVQLSFNQIDANTAHPALSSDEKWLYFVSDRTQGYGQSDLYRVEILDNGKFGEVENLGNEINTESRESFPFISQQNVLYFASDGHPGLGGLDIYGVQINADNSLGELSNLGSTVNTPYDDFAFYLDQSGTMGFLSSNRPNEKAKDNLYLVRHSGEIDFHYFQDIVGYVYDIESKQPIENAVLSLYDKQGNVIAQNLSDANGKFVFANNLCFTAYELKVYKQGFNAASIGIGNLSNKQALELNFGLDTAVSTQEFAKGENIGDFLSLTRISFDFNKSVIRPDAERELYKVLEFLFENSSVHMDIKSFTDAVGDAQYNLILSQKRADATKNWFVKRGIEASRLSAKGYGDTQPLNHCGKAVKCTDKEHSVNRRSEFIVR